MGEERGNIWVDTLWITRQESITVGNVRREVSVGMSVKNDYRATLQEIYPRVDKALSMLVEEEKSKWIDTDEMRKISDEVRGKNDETA